MEFLKCWMFWTTEARNTYTVVPLLIILIKPFKYLIIFERMFISSYSLEII